MFILLGIPVIAVLLLFFFHKPQMQHVISISASVLLFLTGAHLTRDVMLFDTVQSSFGNGTLYLDSLSIIVLDILLFIGLITSVYSVGYLSGEIRHGKITAHQLRIYYLLLYCFLFTMILAFTAKNMGIMWIAIEATTLASAFLVGLYNDRHSLEAAWKYVIICSVGIAVALLGITFLHLSSIGVLETAQFLNWTDLYEHAASLDASAARLGFIFILVGFGTKAGLAPMHTWLPDAHSQAPSPISALLSGVLLNSAMYGLIRTAAIVNRTLGGSEYTGRLFIAAGMLSIAIAAAFILTQKDYKRLLAYSSIEHMGIIAIALGIFSPLSVFGALLHMINHSLTKSMLFLSSGQILQKYNTKHIFRVKGVLKILPVSGLVFLLGLFAIGGAPPFSVFSSEFCILTSVFEADSLWLGGAFALLLAIVFAGIALTLFHMFYGTPEGDAPAPGELNIAGTVCIALLLVLVLITGLYLPEGAKELLTRAQSMITGG